MEWKSNILPTRPSQTVGSTRTPTLVMPSAFALLVVVPTSFVLRRRLTWAMDLGVEMKLTPSDLLIFAKTSQQDQWETLSRGKPFQFSVSNAGITISLSSGKFRNITNQEIIKFCNAFGSSMEEERKVKKKIHNFYYLFAIAMKYSLQKADFRFPEEVTEGSLSEGAIRTVQVNSFERNPEARLRCIQAHGTSCVVCRFNFGSAYGDFARDFIHVHHINPLALQRTEHTVDPIRDLRPVCPNCHAVIHMRNGCLSIEEAKAMLCNN